MAKNIGIKFAKPARFSNVSDDTYNARRRYVREAKRNVEKAGKTTGSSSARYRKLAEEAYKKALQTYTDTKQRVSKDIRQVGEALCIDYQKRREAYAQQGQNLERLREQSFEFTGYGAELAGKTARRREAETVFNSPIGKRIIGGLEGIWRDAASYTVHENGIKVTKIDKSKIFPALFDYFGVDTLEDLLARIEKEISDLYTSEYGEETENYDTVKLAITKAYKSGAFVA